MTRQWGPGSWAELDLRLSDGCSKHREHGEGDHNVVAVKGVSERAGAGMARKTSKASSLVPEDEVSPSSRSHSRNLSLFEKLPVFSDVRNKTAGGGLLLYFSNIQMGSTTTLILILCRNIKIPKNIYYSLTIWQVIGYSLLKFNFQLWILNHIYHLFCYS